MEKVYEDNNKAAIALMEQAYALLNKSGSTMDGEVNEALEKILLLRNSQDKIQKAFNNFSEVATSIMELDFSKRSILPPSLRDNANLFNYFSQTLNMINEELEQRVISKKITDNIITQLSDLSFNNSSSFVIVTDKKGFITFVNNSIEETSGLKSEQWYGREITSIFEDGKAIGEKLTTENQIKDLSVNLSLNNGNLKLGGKLNAFISKNEMGQIEGMVYLFSSPKKLKKREKDKITKWEKETEELENLVKEYNQLTQFWIDESVQLTSDEVLSLDYYLNHRSNKSVLTSSLKNKNALRKTYALAIKKLNDSLHNYDQWILNKAKKLKQKNYRSGIQIDHHLKELPESIPYKERTASEILQEYNNLWKTWINQGALLNIKEDLAVTYYLNYQSHEVLSAHLNHPTESIRATFKDAIRKIRFAVQRYHSWIIVRLLDNKQEINTENSSSNKDLFLKTSLRELDLPVQLIRILEASDFHTPEDICIKTDVKKLSKINGMGKKKLETIIQLFEKHDCQNFLK